MCTILEISEPGLQSWGVVFLDHVAGSEDRGGAGNRCPFAGGIEEGDVDVRVGIDVAGLARFGVGVEDEVDAVIFLFIVSDVWCSGGEKG